MKRVSTRSTSVDATSRTPRGDPVVVDWRAPVSVPFYRATVQDPFGLKRRRRFSIEGHHLLDILDEVFDDPDSC